MIGTVSGMYRDRVLQQRQEILEAKKKDWVAQWTVHQAADSDPWFEYCIPLQQQEADYFK